MSQLLPCPFCGHGSPEYDDVGGFVACGNEGCGAMGPNGVDSAPDGSDLNSEEDLVKRSAYELWNKRADIQSPRVPCEFPNCPNEAVYEGWYRRRDPFLGTPSGHIVRIAICEEHKTHPHLCANEPRPNKQGG